MKSYVKAPIWALAVFSALAPLMAANLARAQAPVAFEPFKYNNVGGPPDNGGTGWAGAWSGGSVVKPGLTCKGWVPTPSGNALGPAGLFVSRALASPVARTPGSSLVMSALIKSDVNGGVTQATLGNLSGGTFTIGDLPESPAVPYWALQNASGVYYNPVSADLIKAGETACLVAQIDFGVPGGGGNDRMRLWVNPPSNQTYFVKTPDVDETTAQVGRFSSVFWQTQQQQDVDEINISATSNSCIPPPNTTMVAWYPFDQTTTNGTPPITTTPDIAGGNTGTVFGATSVAGMVGPALHFDGSTSYVEYPSTIITNIGPAVCPSGSPTSGAWSACPGDFSIDAWIRPASIPGVQVIVDKRAASGPNVIGYSFFAYEAAGGEVLGLQLADNVSPTASGINVLSGVASPALTDGNWHHVAVTVQNRHIQFYHDGVQLGAAVKSSHVGSLANCSPLRVGVTTDQAFGANYFNGDIDEVEIYNRALSKGEVLAIFNAGPFGKCKPC